jgi:hypothetical protein
MYPRSLIGHRYIKHNSKTKGISPYISSHPIFNMAQPPPPPPPGINNPRKRKPSISIQNVAKRVARTFRKWSTKPDDPATPEEEETASSFGTVARRRTISAQYRLSELAAGIVGSASPRHAREVSGASSIETTSSILTTTSIANAIRTPPHPREVAGFEVRGAEYQDWMDGTTTVGCPVHLATLDYIRDIIDSRAEGFPWTAEDAAIMSPPQEIMHDARKVGLPIGPTWHYVCLRQFGISESTSEAEENTYGQFVAQGAIVGDVIFRHHGPHWSEVALAHYRWRYSIDTLQYVWMSNVVNAETRPFVLDYYANNGISTSNDGANRQVWQHDTQPYQIILGTQIGKAVAAIVLGAWAPGTHRISQVTCYFYHHNIYLRFDIVLTPVTPSTAR